jgi:hypothetical protein
MLWLTPLPLRLTPPPLLLLLGSLLMPPLMPPLLPMLLGLKVPPLGQTEVLLEMEVEEMVGVVVIAEVTAGALQVMGVGVEVKENERVA